MLLKVDMDYNPLPVRPPDKMYSERPWSQVIFLTENSRDPVSRCSPWA
jgi:hypothetical protein